MFELAGEELGGSAYTACPGTGCPIWEAAAGDHAYKVETGVCEGCRDCGGNPPDEGSSGSGSGSEETEGEAGNAAAPAAHDEAAEVDDLVQDVADIIAWENAGFTTDWSQYPIEIKNLVKYWRSAETDIANIRESRMQTFLKSWFKEQ